MSQNVFSTKTAGGKSVATLAYPDLDPEGLSPSLQFCATLPGRPSANHLLGFTTVARRELERTVQTLDHAIPDPIAARYAHLPVKERYYAMLRQTVPDFEE